MIVSSKQLLESLLNNKKDVLDTYIGKKFKDFDFQTEENTENLTSIIMRYIFFFDGDKFSYKLLFAQKENTNWLSKLLKSFFRNLLEVDNNIEAYEYLNRFFSLHYVDIIQNYSNFIQALNQVKQKFQYDLCSCLISFLSFLNGNKKYKKIITDIGNHETISNLKSIYQKRRENGLWVSLADYCLLNKIPIIFEYNPKNLCPQKFCIDIEELKCFVDLCYTDDSIRKFIQTLYICTKGSKDFRNNKPVILQNYINDIFLILTISLKNCVPWNYSFLSTAYNEIYQMAFKYTTENFDQNYIDFVIQYVMKYNLEVDDFFHLFMNGLIEGNFNASFKNLQLKENITDINDIGVIKGLINKMTKRKKRRKNNISIKLNNDDEVNKIEEEYSSEKNPGNEKTIEKAKNSLSSVPQKESTQKKQVQNAKEKEGKSLKNQKISELSLNEPNKNQELSLKEMNTKIEKLEREIGRLREVNFNMKKILEELEDDNEFLTSENNKKDIKIKKLSQEIRIINQKLDIISFRNFTKQLLDNMIAFVQDINKFPFKEKLKEKRKTKTKRNKQKN